MIGDNTEAYLLIEIKMRKIDGEKQASLARVLSTYKKACKCARKLAKENRNDPDFYYDYIIQATTLGNILKGLE